ncbi:fungal specific transcription factor [Stagonosporopsis vannaccii]|nr:fungal specific transcription factor [Stagonosporopsis vannaccii]
MYMLCTPHLVQADQPLGTPTPAGGTGSQLRCDRCRQRGIEDRCFYHPAPLTKPRNEHPPETSNEARSGESRPLKRKRPSTQPQKPSGTGRDGGFSPTTPGDEKLADAVAADTYSPGYLGPGSYALLLPQDDGPEQHPRREASAASDTPEHELTHQYTLKKAMRREVVTSILSAFRHYTAIQELILWYNASNEAGVIPAQLQIDAINAIGPFVERHNLRRAPPTTQLVDLIMENSSKPLCVSHVSNPRDLYKSCSGDNLRLEMIGFLLATAGRSLTFGFSPDTFSGPGNRGLRARFMDELLSASTQCITITSLIATVNDITVWMYYENYLFTTMVCGYSGPPSWRRINDLATQIYALGMHKESASVDIPIWLTETRRRIFCSSYNQDKSISTFLGRPIRISKRHTDIKMPLDLRDDEITGDPAELEAAINRLDAGGWNTRGQHLRASWIRLRHIASRLREEILDFSLTTIDASVERDLLDISTRIRTSWANLPSHMRYWKTCWDESYPSSVCLMLVVIHLTHWYNEFMIQKLLDYTPLTSNAAMLRVSVDLLSNVLALGAIRDRTYDVHRDLLNCILLYGIPSASVLATALRQQAQTAAPFPAGISRAEIVRMLSVLISHLDASAHLENSGARAGEANYNLCRKASKIFTRVIDQVLDPKLSEVTPSNSEGNEAGIEGEMGLDLFGVPGLDGFEGMEFAGMVGGSAVMEGNGMTVDWGALGQWTL